MFGGFSSPQLSDVLTATEAKEYRAKLSASLHTIFRYLDLGITATNAEKAKAVIWSDIDDEDLTILADVIIDSAKKSRIVATAVKQVSKAHSLLRLGVIMGPKFMETVKFYNAHGGFVFPLMGLKNTEEHVQ